MDNNIVKKDNDGRNIFRVVNQRVALPVKPIDVRKVAEIIKAHEMLGDMINGRNEFDSNKQIQINNPNQRFKTIAEEPYPSGILSVQNSVNNNKSRIDLHEGALVSAINYWKEVRLKLDTILAETRNMGLIIHNSAEFSDLVELISKIPSEKTILYISLTKTYNSVSNLIQKTNKNIYFIDCVSAGIFGKKITHAFATEDMPTNLNELIDLIGKWSQKIDSRFIIIDSLSQFIDFSRVEKNNMQIYEFIDILRRMMSQINRIPLFLYDTGVAKNLSNLPRIQMDTIIQLEIIRENTSWNR